MNWKTLALGCSMMGLATVGCGTSPPARDSGLPVDDGGAPVTRTYVIGMIDTEADDPNDAYGFNLDMADGNPVGMPAGGCQDVMDYTSPVTMIHGVDNQLAGLAPTLDGLLGGDGVNGAIRAQIAAGKVLLMLEVSDINSFTNDPAIMVHAVLGQVSPAGAACRAHTDMASCAADTANMCTFTAGAMGAAGSCATSVAPMPSAACMAHADQPSCDGDQANACSWGAMAAACSGIAAGQTFSVFTDLGTVSGSITAGQLSATTDALPLSFAAMGRNITLTLHSVRFGGRITATGITNGEFGAQILIAELMQTVMDLGFMIDITTFVAPDMMPSAPGNMAACSAHADMASCTADHTNRCAFTAGACVGAPAAATCAALSAGMGYAAIAANLAAH